MLTLKERLEHGDLDSFLNRDEVKELLELYDLAQDPDDDVIEDAREEGRTEGFEDGKAEGEEIEFDRLQSDYKEAKAEAIGDVIVPEWGILRNLITKLDELFEVE